MHIFQNSITLCYIIFHITFDEEKGDVEEK